MTPPRAVQRVGAALPGIVSLLALAGCAWWVSRQDAPRIPTSPNALGLLCAALATYALATLLRGYRFHVILRHAHLTHEPTDAYGLTVVSYMGNTVLPARGGELLRILLLADRTGLRRRDVVGAVVPERLLDAAALALLFSLLTISGAAARELGREPAILAAAGFVAGVIGILAYWRLRIAGHFVALANRIRPLTRASRRLMDWTGAAMVVVTLVVWFLEASVFWLVARALGVEIGLIGAAFAVVAASFLAMVPAGPGFVGTFDAGILFALGVLDVHGGTALSALLMYRLVIFGPITLVGLALMLTRYGGLSMLRRGRGRGDSGTPDDEELLPEEPPSERRLEVSASERA